MKSRGLRRKIEEHNASIHVKLQSFKSSIKADENAEEESAGSGSTAPPAGSRATMAPSSSPLVAVRPVDSPPSDTVQDTMTEEDIESRVGLSLMIEDQEGKDIWAELFGLEAFMIKWDVFVAGLKKVLTEVKEDEERVLQYVLDNSNTGFINQHKFSEFLKGFGNPQDCVKNVRRICSAKWFYGFLTRVESDMLLRDQPAGTYLFRLSSSQPGSFALAFTTQGANNDVTTCHILINSCGPQGFQIQEQENKEARSFQNLHEIIDYYSVFLQKPFSSDLAFESWFEGDVSGAETAEMLAGQPVGTFLVRFSTTQVGAFAVSYVTPEGAISHSLIEHEGVSGGCYRISDYGQPLLFNSLREAVAFYGDALKYPFRAVIGNQLSLDATKYIVQWKAERGQQMVAVDKIIADLFDVGLPMPGMPPKADRDPRVESIVTRLFELSV